MPSIWGGKGRKEREAATPASPYDYKRESELIAEGDLEGWSKFVMARPTESGFGFGIADIIHLAQATARIVRIRDEAVNQPAILRRVAQNIRERNAPLSDDMTIRDYHAALAMHEFAAALEDIAAEEEIA